ncbi:membrAne [Seminavis robusta]|uniref:MembrAne n=1 Tax=Seminavis robusta TaxID=568900 RepID=A0A9N8ETM4_9STRA|nr:membrAne [Seminavis robusta]|eukprot:Sro1660_g289260.1 membrAne (602) ;mRNA; f:805-2610
MDQKEEDDPIMPMVPDLDPMKTDSATAVGEADAGSNSSPNSTSRFLPRSSSSSSASAGSVYHDTTADLGASTASVYHDAKHPNPPNLESQFLHQLSNKHGGADSNSNSYINGEQPVDKAPLQLSQPPASPDISELENDSSRKEQRPLGILKNKKCNTQVRSEEFVSHERRQCNIPLTKAKSTGRVAFDASASEGSEAGALRRRLRNSSNTSIMRSSHQLMSDFSELVIEKVDPEPETEEGNRQESAFVIAVGILMSFNMGFVNGACFSGFVTGTKHPVAGYTTPYTEAALQLAQGGYEQMAFQLGMIFCFIGGSYVSGVITPNATPYRIEPSYGPSFLMAALCLGTSSILAATEHSPDLVFYLAGVACGIQNGIASTYSAKLIRATGLTGSSTDIGLYLGQLTRGNKENAPKLIILILLSFAFWLGGLISFWVTRHFTSLTLLFSTGLFLLIGSSLVIFLSKKLGISIRAALLGTWQWQQAVEKLQDAFGDGLEGSVGGMTDAELEEIFDRIDVDNSGTIDAEELYILLRSTGVKVTRRESDMMLHYADKDGNGTLDKDEWKQAIHGAFSKKRTSNGLGTISKMATFKKSRRNLMDGMSET